MNDQHLDGVIALRWLLCSAIMLRSYDPAFIFIHVSKAAGTSIQNALRPFAHQPESLPVNQALRRIGCNVNHIGPHRWKMFREHATARTVRRHLPTRIYRESFKFAFVRNPWDWVVSVYHYILQTPSHHRHVLVKSMSSFNEYLSYEVRQRKRFQHEFVTDRHGQLIVDYIGRFETLANDYAHVCRTLKINAPLPHVNGSAHKDFRAYYTRKTIDIVAAHFRKDIELFKYEFDEKKAS